MDENMAGIERQQPNPEAFHELSNPDFNAGNFVMYLTSDPKGFQLETDKSLPRKDFPLPLNADEKAKLRFAMEGEMKFTGGVIAQEELNELRSEQNSAHVYEKKRQDYVDRGNKPKVGLRNIRRDGNKIIVDIKPITYPVFSSFSNNEARSAEVKNLAEAAATSMTIITSDNKLLIQHRSGTNALYPEMPGASIAGMFDGTFKRPEAKRLHFEKKGTLEKITASSVLANIKNESREEMGIDESDFSSIILTGLSEELYPQAHHEFLFKAKTKLTSKDIKQKSLMTSRARKKELKPEDIEEKFDFIEATPDAIFTLLTKVKCPLPPTHAAVFAATGYDLVLEKSGKTAADEYKKQLETGIKENYEQMDTIISKYYKDDPAKLNELPERMAKQLNDTVEKFKALNPKATEAEIMKVKSETIQKFPKRNAKGYSPAFTPNEQGLPDYDTAMQESGLIK